MPLDRVLLGLEDAQRILEQFGQLGSVPFGRQLRDLRTDAQPGLEDAAENGDVEFAIAKHQPGQQVQAGVPPEIAHGGDAAMAHLDQTGRRQPLKRLADSGPGYPENVCQAALAGQRRAGLHLAAEHIGRDLVEDLLQAPIGELPAAAPCGQCGWSEVSQVVRPPACRKSFAAVRHRARTSPGRVSWCARRPHWRFGPPVDFSLCL